MMARVRSVTAAATCVGIDVEVTGPTSTKTGAAPACTITFAVAGHVIGVVIDLVARPDAEREQRQVHRGRARADCERVLGAPGSPRMRCSSSAPRGPVVSQPERSVSATCGDLLLAQGRRLRSR